MDNRQSHIRHSFRVGPTDYGKWLAVSDCNPYFVFQGDSPEDVEAIANRALDFYFGISGKIKSVKLPARERTQTLSSFSSKRIVERQV
jgi:predicted RNase H-like HicB family nuclease